MTTSYPSIKNSYEQLISVRPKPMYVGMFLGLQIGVAAICGSQAVSLELLKAALGPQLRTVMFLWAMVSVIVVVARNNLTQEFSIPNALLYAVKIPYDLFAFTLGSLISMFIVFVCHYAIVGVPHGPLLGVIFLAGVMSFAAKSILVLSVNFAASNLREGVTRLIHDRKLRNQYFLVVVLGGLGMSGEYLYRVLSKWFA